MFLLDDKLKTNFTGQKCAYGRQNPFCYQIWDARFLFATNFGNICLSQCQEIHVALDVTFSSVPHQKCKGGVLVFLS